MIDRTGQQFGQYKLIKLLGRGGFAEVYLGEHIYLHTTAAIKILHDSLTPGARQKFLHEAQINARLQHPHIVRVLDCGIERGNLPYLVMDYAPHGTLRQRHQPGQTVTPDTILSYIKQVAEALDYIHQQQLIHQDVKPENMLLGFNSQVLLSDFGIAIAKPGAQALTYGFGSVSYMAPEQIQLNPGFASDQYALGIVVYEWLCGTCPFTGSTPQDIINEQLHTLPPPLHSRLPTLPLALEQVVHSALAKDPAQRYPTVREFAQAFEQACSNSTFLPPITKPTTQPLRSAPAVLSNTIPVSPPVANTSPPSTTIPVHFPHSHTVPSARKGKQGMTIYVYKGHSHFVNAVAWSPDQQYIASGSDDYQLHIWDATTGDEVCIYTNYGVYIWSLHWSADGKQIVAGGFDQIVRIVDTATTKTLLTYDKHHKQASALGKACAVSWSPNGQYIASGGGDHLIHIWDASSAKTLNICQGHTDDINAIAWSPDGQRLASASYDTTVRVWNSTTGKTLVLSRHHNKCVNAVAWSPDGTLIASGSNDRTVQVWDATTGEVIHQLAHIRRVRAVAWSPDGTLIASGSNDKAVYLWSASTGDHRFTYGEHSDEINAVAWSPDNRYLASASCDRTVHVWQTSL
jgi:serine/threonine protein kinase